MVWVRGSFILVLAVIALGLLLLGLAASFTASVPCNSDAFVPVVPDMRIQTVASNPDVVELNGCWRKLLSYLQANPDKAMPFLNFAKANFFNANCSLRRIPFFLK